ncbi:MAG: zf-TFIIB domain-containing protein [Chloroflexi bacterium]|nr:zf-TFIIB domain-containing protein [Chloroflexota bacterium]
MKCPVCNVDLKMADRQGIEIDYCPQCRGVWLDRGELDKIIERSTAYDQQPPRAAPLPQQYTSEGPVPQQKRRDDDHYYDDNRYDDDRYKYQQGKKKKGFLGEMFDIFD